MRKQFSGRGIAVLLSLTLLAAACGDDDDPGGEAPTDGTPSSEPVRLVIALGEEPAALDPHLQEQNAPDSQYYEQLFKFTEEGEFAPYLAAEIPTPDDDTATLWEIKLRDGVTYHDGTPMTAELVAASLNNLFKRGEGVAEEANRLGPVWDTATAVDDLTMSITLTASEPLLPQRLAFVHVTKPDNPSAADSPIGTGPYKFVEWNRGESIILERYADYWGDEPQVDEIEYRIVPEVATQIAGFEAGEFDVLFNLSIEDAQSISGDNVEIIESGELPHIVFNTRGGITADPRVRQALNMAIDREALNELFGGEGQVLQCQPLKEDYLGFNPDLEAPAYDPDGARDLLEEAGVAGATFDLVGAEGRWPKDREQAEAIAEMWNAVGLNVTPTVYGVSEDYLDAILAQPDRPVALFVSKSTEILDGANEASYLNAPGPDPSASSTTQEVADRFNELRQIVDLDERAAGFQEFYADLCDQANFAYLVSSPLIWAHSDAVESLHVLPIVEASWTRVADIELAS